MKFNFNNIFNPGVIGDLLSLAAGALLTLAFAPFHIFPLAIFSPALLLALWLRVSPSRAFFRGWLFGLGLFGTGVYWVFISMNSFGNLSVALSALFTFFFIMILALFPALNGYFLNRYFPRNHSSTILCAFPAIWLLIEWIRSWIFSGFPWLSLGYSQMNSPLRGYAPIFSVYGVSLIVLFCSSLLVNLIKQFPQKKYKIILWHVLAFALIWLIGFAFTFISWTKPDGQPVKTSLVQGNITQDLKWSQEEIIPTMEHYKKLTEAHWDSKIIIWPEAALPLPAQSAESFLEIMSKEASDHHVSLITGIPIKAPDKSGYYNTVITLGEGKGVYVKQRLVPFGEYVPAAFLQHFFDSLNIPMSEFIPGKEKLPPLTIDGIKIAAFICYEIAFPEQVLSRDGNIGVILTVSNDAWFGRSIAQAQHLEMAEMRALEMGRPVLFVSNTGITAFIDPNGKIKSAAPPYESYVLTDTVQAMKGKTPWQYVSMDPVLGMAILLLIIAVFFRKRDQ